jgi:hypothetical protein
MRNNAPPWLEGLSQATGPSVALTPRTNEAPVHDFQLWRYGSAVGKVRVLLDNAGTVCGGTITLAELTSTMFEAHVRLLVRYFSGGVPANGVDDFSKTRMILIPIRTTMGPKTKRRKSAPPSFFIVLQNTKLITVGKRHTWTAKRLAAPHGVSTRLLAQHNGDKNGLICIVDSTKFKSKTTLNILILPSSGNDGAVVHEVNFAHVMPSAVCAEAALFADSVLGSEDPVVHKVDF